MARQSDDDETFGLVPDWAGQFASFDKWVSGAENRLSGVVDSNGYPMSAMCVDTLGRRCHNGRDFMRARDEGTFPVRYFWEMRPDTSSTTTRDGEEPNTASPQVAP